MNEVPRQSRICLPPLKPDHDIRPPAPGQWQDLGDYGQLRRIAESLKIANVPEGLEKIVSIPDVWAHVEVFRYSIQDENHPLHRIAIGEWRGLLALFALKSYRDYDLQTEIIRLEGFGKDRMGAVLNASAPKIVALNGHHWREIGAIMLNGHLIGLLVPSTIVAPRRGYGEFVDSSIAWFKNGRFIDPCSADAADVQYPEFATIEEFARRLDETIARQKDNYATPDLVAALRRELGAFAEDARRAKERRRGTGSVELEGSEKTISLRIPAQSGADAIYTDLLRAIKFVDRRGPASDAVMALRPELAKELSGQFKGAIITDADLPRQLGINATQLKIWETLSTHSIQRDGNVRERVRREARDVGYWCIDSSELFAPKLCLLKEREIDWHEGDFRRWLYPLTPAILLFLGPEEIRQRVDIRPFGDGYAVSLRLRIQTGGTTREYTVTKNYQKSDIVERSLGPTSLSLWPNFNVPEWKWYFIFFGGNLLYSFGLRGAASAQGFAAGLRKAAGPGETVDMANSLLRGPFREADRLGLVEQEGAVELYRIEHLFDALVCDATRPEHRGWATSEDRDLVGLLLRPNLKRPERQVDSQMQIAIDFGTSNTCIYAQFGTDETPQPLKFVSRLTSAFKASGTATAAEHRDFLPIRDIRVPFMTILRDRTAPGTDRPDLPIWTGHIYFIDEMLHALHDAIGRDSARPLRFDLKWSNDPNDRLRVRRFLGQLALMCLAEAVSRGFDIRRIRWRISYPQAFTDRAAEEFRDLFLHGLSLAIDPSGREPLPYDRVTHDNESVSAALFFNHAKKVPFTATVITLDIGGGTTDISLWQNQKLLWCTSAKLAGRNILIPFLHRHGEIFDQIDLRRDEFEYLMPLELKTLLGRVSQSSDAQRRYAIDMIVNTRAFKNGFSSYFPTHGRTRIGEDLHSVAELALAGMLYYIGRQMKHLRDKKILQESLSFRSVTICLGGRASLLYKTLFEHREEVLRHVKSMLGLGAEDNTLSVKVEFSDRSKQEVAYGLLVPKSGRTNLDLSAVSDETVLGEEIHCGEKIFPPDASITELKDCVSLRVEEVKGLRSFLDTLARTAQVFVPLSDEGSIVGKVNGALVDRLSELAKFRERTGGHGGSIGDAMDFEPIFIVALRALIESVIEGKTEVKRMP